MEKPSVDTESFLRMDLVSRLETSLLGVETSILSSYVSLFSDESAPILECLLVLDCDSILSVGVVGSSVPMLLASLPMLLLVAGVEDTPPWQDLRKFSTWVSKKDCNSVVIL